jgi:hypothetical protein
MLSKGTIFSIVFLIVFVIPLVYIDLDSPTSRSYDVKASETEYLEPPTNSTCYFCHANLSGLLKGKVAQPAVEWRESIHFSTEAVVMCADCHGGDPSTYIIFDSMSEEYNYTSNLTRESSVEICGKCHISQTDDFKQSVHWLMEDSRSRLSCVDCHDNHRIRSSEDPKSTTFLPNIPETCGECHIEAFNSYIKTFHGKNLNFDNHNVAVCTDCHGGHYILPETDKNSTLHVDNLQDSCNPCHESEDAVKMTGIFHRDDETHSPNLMFEKDDLNDDQKRYFIGPIDLGFYIPYIYGFMIVIFVFTLITLIILETVVSKVFRRE